MTGPDEGEVHPDEFVTVNVYVSSAGRLLIVMELPDDIVVTLPGIRVIVQLPKGKPLNTTLPVEVVHVG